MISTPDIRLKPIHNPSNPPICDMYWIRVILSSLVYSNTVGVSKKKVTMAISFSYASYLGFFSRDAENTRCPLTFGPRKQNVDSKRGSEETQYKFLYLCNLYNCC